ncbi:hypothetical protein HKX48_004576 [Thoreauomyces humboldtii]|nr:hypothetical protein HKX48_004576 [Thoreauomyces humboldtii]
MSASSVTNTIPLVYRLVFTYIDPVFCLMGFYLHIFQPHASLLGYSLLYDSPKPDTATVHLLDSMAAFFLTLGILEAVLLRVRSRDVAVWRIVHGCVALLDVGMTLAACRALNKDGRLTPVTEWNGDDLRLVVGNAGIGILRVLCALGVGMPQEGSRVKKLA